MMKMVMDELLLSLIFKIIILALMVNQNWAIFSSFIVSSKSRKVVLI